MSIVPFIAVAALAVAGVSLWRLSRLPKPLPAVEERTFSTLRAGDVVIVPDGEWLVASVEDAKPARVVALRSGREKRWLVGTDTGPLALLDQKPEAPDVDRAVAAQGARKLDRATVDLLPGEPLPASGGRA